VEAHLLDQIVPAWFPRCVNRETGGFRQDFHRDWKSGTAGPRTLVFQARATWAAAALARAYPSRSREFGGYALHGAAFLKARLWDRVHGGFHWDETGEGEKHAYGMAFGIMAAAAVHRATGEEEALNTAIEAFEWLDRHAHDEVSGGYREALGPEGGSPTAEGGRPPFDQGQPASPGRRPPAEGGPSDRIGNPRGRKSSDTHLHLLEAFLELREVWPDPVLETRLRELLHLVRTRLIREPGFLPGSFSRDWTPRDDKASFGHDLEMAFLLLQCEALGFGTSSEAGGETARALAMHALEHGFDGRNGGFFLEGRAGAPAHRREKVWWVQAESFNALAALYRRFGSGSPDFLTPALRTWDFILRCQADFRHGEWYAVVHGEGDVVLDDRKGYEWKAPYHTTRSLLAAVASLRGFAEASGKFQDPGPSPGRES
jgi:mannobiose 2-epimerase